MCERQVFYEMAVEIASPVIVELYLERLFQSIRLLLV